MRTDCDIYKVLFSLYFPFFFVFCGIIFDLLSRRSGGLFAHISNPSVMPSSLAVSFFT